MHAASVAGSNEVPTGKQHGTTISLTEAAAHCMALWPALDADTQHHCKGR